MREWWKRLRQHGLLDACGRAQIALHRDELIPCFHRMSNDFELPYGFLHREIEILKIDRLCQEVEGTPVHGSADVFHIPVRGDNDGLDTRIVPLTDLLQKCQAVHLGHVDVRKDN